LNRELARSLKGEKMEQTVESNFTELLKSETKSVILYCDTSRLYFDNGEWWVRAGNRKHNTVLYCGNDFNEALLALAAG